MFFKKLILLIIAGGTFFFAIIAGAELHTVNLTNEYAVSMIMTSSICAGTFNALNITAPGETNNLSTNSVRKQCAYRQPCEAYLILAKDFDHATRCSGKTIARTIINDLKTDNVKIDVTYDSNYNVTVNDNKVTITSNIKK